MSRIELDKIIELINKHQQQYTKEDLKWKTDGRKWYWILDKIHDISINLSYIDKESFTQKRIQILKLFLELIRIKIEKA